MYPHRIRLRGPWEAEPLARFVPRADGGHDRRADGLPPPMRVTMPARWRDAGLSGFAGVVRLRRRFGLPRHLDDFERVWLTAEGVTGSSEWRLNGELLGQFRPDGSALEFEVTPLLHGRNELTVEVEAPDDTGGLWGEVALEIRCRAYLRNVRAEWVDGRCRVTGDVAGEEDAPLEVYVLMDSRTVGYGACHAGGPFEVMTDELPGVNNAAFNLRVDLVRGAVIWYVAEVQPSTK